MRGYNYVHGRGHHHSYKEGKNSLMYNLRQQLLKVAALLLPLRLGSSPVQQDDLAASPVLAAVEGGHRDLGGVRGGGGELEQGGKISQTV